MCITFNEDLCLPLIFYFGEESLMKNMRILKNYLKQKILSAHVHDVQVNEIYNNYGGIS